MKKTTKLKRSLKKNLSKVFIGLGLSLALVLAVTTVAQANLSIWDRIAIRAGDTLGEGLLSQIGDVSESIFGAIPGGDVNTHLYAHDGFTQGGTLATTTTVNAYTTSAKDFKGTPTYWDITPGFGPTATTITLNSTSTRDYVPNIGDVSKIYVRNSTSTVEIPLTFAAQDSGLDLQHASTTADVTIVSNSWAEITIVRESQYLTSMLFQEFWAAD